MKEKKCRNCRILERKLLQLARKYDKLGEYTLRGKSIDDLNRTLAENKVIEIFRKAGVFGYPTLEPRLSPFVVGGVSQSFNYEKAIEVLENITKHT